MQAAYPTGWLTRTRFRDNALGDGFLARSLTPHPTSSHLGLPGNGRNGTKPEAAELEQSFRSAPIPVVRVPTIGRLKSTHNGPSRQWATRAVDDLKPTRVTLSCCPLQPMRFGFARPVFCLTRSNAIG